MSCIGGKRYFLNHARREPVVCRKEGPQLVAQEHFSLIAFCGVGHAQASHVLSHERLPYALHSVRSASRSGWCVDGE